jgi:hypothetical protein
MRTKQCTKCRKVKRLDEFRRWSHGRDGRGYRCRECERAGQRERRDDPAYRGRENARRREWRAVPEVRICDLARKARQRAEARGLDFDEDLSDLLPLPTRCPALGIPLRWATGEGPLRDGPSIDRIDPAKGYVKGNRIVVSCLANQIKSSATPDQIRKVADFYEGLAKRRNQR